MWLLLREACCTGVMTNMSNPPNEKVCEELFLAYTLQYARSGKLTLYAPSQREEIFTGYDAALFTGNCRELILQFKRAYTNSEGLYFDIVDQSVKKKDPFKATQQRNLLQRYPPNSAFYVTGSFVDVKELFKAQSDQLTVTGFLDRYMAVPAHVLEEGERVHFKKFGAYHDSRYVKSDKTEHPLKPYQWLTGSELLKRFLHPTRYEAGAMLRKNSANMIEILPNPAEPGTDLTRSIPVDQGWLSNLLPDDSNLVSIVFIRYCE